MAKAITEQEFTRLKGLEYTNKELKQCALKLGVSTSTLTRIRKAKNYAEFKELLVKDRGPRYSERRVSSKPQPQKKGLWVRFLNFFDISVQR